VCSLQSVDIDWIGLNLTNRLFNGPLIGRSHTNLGWSPRAHDAIYKKLRGHKKANASTSPQNPNPDRGPHRLSIGVSESVTTHSGSDPDACCSFVGQQNDDNNSNNSPTTMKVCFPIPLSSTDLLVIEALQFTD
jgi:hypothetical protein